MSAKEVELGEDLIRRVFRNRIDKTGKPMLIAYTPRVPKKEGDKDDKGMLSNRIKSRTTIAECLKGNESMLLFKVHYDDLLKGKGILAIDDSDVHNPAHAFIDFRDLSTILEKKNRAEILCNAAKQLRYNGSGADTSDNI